MNLTRCEENWGTTPRSMLFFSTRSNLTEEVPHTLPSGRGGVMHSIAKITAIQQQIPRWLCTGLLSASKRL